MASEMTKEAFGEFVDMLYIGMLAIAVVTAVACLLFSMTQL